MKCSRCGRIIKTNNYSKIGNYFYGSTCARKMHLTQSKRKVIKLDTVKENINQLDMFDSMIKYNLNGLNHD